MDHPLLMRQGARKKVSPGFVGRGCVILITPRINQSGASVSGHKGHKKCLSELNVQVMSGYAALSALYAELCLNKPDTFLVMLGKKNNY
jgi:hypothetical protein